MRLGIERDEAVALLYYLNFIAGKYIYYFIKIK